MSNSMPAKDTPESKKISEKDANQDLSKAETLSHYLKQEAGTRQGRSIPPLDKWHPEQTVDMDLVIKANGEWWHDGSLITRQSLISLFATVLCSEHTDKGVEYFLKTPVQKMRIKVEDAPLLINDVGIVKETVNGKELSWLEFATTTGDIVRLDDSHPITLRAYQVDDDQPEHTEASMRPYMTVRNDLTALIGRNTFYHLTEIGELTEQNNQTILTLHSGGQDYQLSMPNN